MQWDKKAVLLALAVFFAYFFFGVFNFLEFGAVGNTQDYLFHWGQLQGYPQEHPYWSVFLVPPNLEYSSFYHMVAFPFGFHPLAFYTFNLVIILLLIPFFVFKLSKSFYSLLIYFFGCSLAHMVLYSGTFPHALTLLFVIIYFNYRKTWVFFPLAFLAFCTHSRGLILFGLIAAIELICLFLKNKKGNWSIGWLGNSFLRTPAEIVTVLIVHLPAPLLYYFIKAKKELFYSLLFVAAILAGYMDVRTITVSQLVLCVVVGPKLATVPKRLKIMLALFFLIEIVILAWDFPFGSYRSLLYN